MNRPATQPPLPLNVPVMLAAVRAELRNHVMPDWAQRAACASGRFDPDWWSTPAGDPAQTVARTICGSCPVRRSCLAHALATGEPDGIWGGFDESERAWQRLALAEGTGSQRFSTRTPGRRPPDDTRRARQDHYRHGPRDGR